MGEVSETVVIASVENVLEHILHIAEISSGDTFASHFIKGLSAVVDILVKSGITLLCEFTGNTRGVTDTETIRPFLLSQYSGVVIFPICNRGPDFFAVFANDFKHRRFSGANITP